MTNTDEILALADRMAKAGASVLIEFDAHARTTEGRMIVNTVQITDAKGIGPYPMSPIGAAERMRAFLAAAA